MSIVSLFCDVSGRIDMFTSWINSRSSCSDRLAAIAFSSAFPCSFVYKLPFRIWETDVFIHISTSSHSIHL